MADETNNHGLNMYTAGETGWTHSTDMAHIEERLPVSDEEINRSNYEPYEGTLFLSTDTGAIYEGDGTSWTEVDWDMGSVSVNGNAVATQTWVSSNFTDYTFSESHDDLTGVSSDDHHSRYTDAEAEAAVTTFSGSYSDLTGRTHGNEDHDTTFASETWVSNNFTNYTFSESYNDLSNRSHGNEDHNTTYAAESDLFSGSYTDLIDVPNTFNPSTHGDAAHSENYAKSAELFSGNYPDLNNRLHGNEDHTSTFATESYADSSYTDSDAQSALNNTHIVASQLSVNGESTFDGNHINNATFFPTYTGGSEKLIFGPFMNDFAFIDKNSGTTINTTGVTGDVSNLFDGDVNNGSIAFEPGGSIEIIGGLGNPYLDGFGIVSEWGGSSVSDFTIEVRDNTDGTWSVIESQTNSDRSPVVRSNASQFDGVRITVDGGRKADGGANVSQLFMWNRKTSNYYGHALTKSGGTVYGSTEFTDGVQASEATVTGQLDVDSQDDGRVAHFRGSSAGVRIDTTADSGSYHERHLIDGDGIHIFTNSSSRTLGLGVGGSATDLLINTNGNVDISNDLSVSGTISESGNQVATRTWANSNFNNYTFSEVHSDLTGISSDDHHSRYTDSEAQAAVDTFSGSYGDLTNVPSTFSPSDHDNAAHSTNFATQSAFSTHTNDTSNPHNVQSVAYADEAGDADTLDGLDSSDLRGAKQSAHLTAADDSYDINTSGWTEILWDTPLDVDAGFTHDASASPSEITITEPGTYRVHAGISFETTVVRANPGVAIAVNGTRTGRLGLSGYVRSGSGHNEASNSIVDQVTVSAGDTLTIMTTQFGASGTITLRPNESTLLIEKVSETVPLSGDADTLDGNHAADFAADIHGNEAHADTFATEGYADGAYTDSDARSAMYNHTATFQDLTLTGDGSRIPIAFDGDTGNNIVAGLVDYSNATYARAIGGFGGSSDSVPNWEISSGGDGYFRDFEFSSIASDNITVDEIDVGNISNPSGATGTGANRTLYSQQEEVISVPNDYSTIQDALDALPIFINHTHRIEVDTSSYSNQEDISLPTTIHGNTNGSVPESSATALVEIESSDGSRLDINSVYAGGNYGVQFSLINTRLHGPTPYVDRDVCACVVASRIRFSDVVFDTDITRVMDAAFECGAEGRIKIQHGVDFGTDQFSAVAITKDWSVFWCAVAGSNISGSVDHVVETGSVSLVDFKHGLGNLSTDNGRFSPPQRNLRYREGGTEVVPDIVESGDGRYTRVERTSSRQTIPDGSWTLMSFDGEKVPDPHNGWNTELTRWTAPHDGVYYVEASAMFLSSDQVRTGLRVRREYVGGSSETWSSSIDRHGSDGGVTTYVGTMIPMEEGDVIYAEVLHDGGSDMELHNAGPNTYMAINKMQLR